MSDHYLRLTHHNIFKNVAHERLHEFLAPFADYLATRGIKLPRLAIDDKWREEVRLILRQPDDGTPRTLLQSAHFVNDLCTESCMEKLLDRIDGLAAKFREEENSTIADVAVEAFLHHHDDAEEILRWERVQTRKSFQYFQAKTSEPPEILLPLEPRRLAFQDHVSQYHIEKRCGPFVDVTIEETETMLRLLVSHGSPLKAIKLVENGQPVDRHSRPRGEAMLELNKLAGELKINAATLTRRQMYRSAFGECFFDDEEMFPDGKIWTADPLVIDGRKSLSVADVPQLLNASLVSVKIALTGGVPEYVRTDREALIDVLEDRIATFSSYDEEVRIIEARIALTFADSRRIRMCTIRPPNFAAFGRDGDADVIEDFLRKRGFINGRRIKPFALPGAGLESRSLGASVSNVSDSLAEPTS
ncbi:hypothetical protein [Novipirellula artificiosorum]|uniref:Uncharacterized protein n=1 Tax=Novipirellula artificiosorum TaxID=2528016 RepID=A0A5C6DR89_9BACT|nr:hypothetical protein [Novipirellula artificiosorum]TWU39360.1 hypothetical protein Poly41_21840 [Novipirellula artificiosorum]